MKRSARPSRAVAAFAAIAFGAALPCQRDELQARINAALDAAKPALLEHLDNRPRAGELALVLLAALHDGMSETDPAIQGALQWLLKAEDLQTYDLALRLMVIEVLVRTKELTAIAADDTRELLRHMHDGGFHYQRNPNNWDLSNTQYGALGLRAAANIGVDVDRRTWARLADRALESQFGDGSFGYQNTNRSGSGTPSMTVAGIGVLALAQQYLAGGDRRHDSVRKAIERGWGWMDRQVASIGDPKERWCYYFHYGLLRAAVLSDVLKVGDQDWYRLGARMLVDAQLGGGGWDSKQDGFGQPAARGRGTPVSTAFAVLFLTRKFQKVAGPVTGARTVLLQQLGAQAEEAQIAACAAGLVARGKSALPDVLKAMRAELAPRRDAAARALHALTGQTFGYDAARDAEANAAALRQAELWYLKNR